MMRRTLPLGLILCACTPAPLDVGETLTTGTDWTTGTTETTDTSGMTTTQTTGAPVCGPPAWFDCPGTDICEILDCDAPLGTVDANGCERTPCSSSEECRAGERCLEIAVAGFCESSGIFCSTEFGDCSCGGSDDCTFGSRCVAESGAAEVDCPVEGTECSALIGWSDLLQFTYVNRLNWGHDELVESVSNCSQKVEGKILDDANLCGLNLCYEACRLHACSGYESTCQKSCEQAAASLTDEQLRIVVSNAAETPGLCTCDICELDSFGFCEAVWDCNMG